MTYDPEKDIDAALRHVGQAQPAEHFEDRILARLQSESRQHDLRGGFFGFLGAPRLAFAAAATLACAAIVAGSVQHSRQHMLPASGIHLPAPGSGLGSASSAHIATQPVIAPAHAHARSERKTANGRGVVSRNAHKPTGVVVPEPQKP